MVQVTVKRVGQVGRVFDVATSAELLEKVDKSRHFSPGGTLEDSKGVVLGSSYPLKEGLEFEWFPPTQYAGATGATSTTGQAGAGASAGAVAGPFGVAGGAALPGTIGADRTRDLLHDIELPDALPPAIVLKDLYAKGPEGQPPLRRRSGMALKLPVHPALYDQLARLSGMAELLEPDTVSQAWALSIVVSAALHPMTPLHLNLDDELSVAGHVDELFGRIISLANTFWSGPLLTRKRNRTDASITRRLARPDFLILYRDSLLFKGEDKAHDGNWKAVIEDLESKVGSWSEAYHGQLEYLMCYAAVGFEFQLFLLKRDNAKAEALCDVVNTQHVLDKVYVIHAAILTAHILRLQAPRLPLSARRLEGVIVRPDGSRIVVSSTHVVKTVPLKAVQDLGLDLDRMQALYTAVKDSEYVVHAAYGPTVNKEHYQVYLQPVGEPFETTSMSGVPALHLRKAVRCILLGLQAIHAANLGHGDLRWENVIGIGTAPEFDSYCIIDLELAQVLGSKPPLRPMPPAWEDGAALVEGQYQVASDLYQLGRMLSQTNVVKEDTCAAELQQELLSKALTVEGALQHAWLQAA